MKKSCHCYGNCRSDRGGRKDKLPALRNVPKKILLEEAAEVDKAGAAVVTNRLGVKTDKVAERKEPMWKRRLQNKIKELRKDLSQLETLKDKYISNFRHSERLEI